ncbi:hypothetical protein JOL62DRAFT_442570 [Phyllosticta paracitricarpa]|uniref:Uncharacterized protein n=1 Tax=Phyllosticta paracitricarpa TaxID=2016321 RepID=A0ABR1NC85_9PEZI
MSGQHSLHFAYTVYHLPHHQLYTAAAHTAQLYDVKEKALLSCFVAVQQSTASWPSSNQRHLVHPAFFFFPVSLGCSNRPFLGVLYHLSRIFFFFFFLLSKCVVPLGCLPVFGIGIPLEMQDAERGQRELRMEWIGSDWCGLESGMSAATKEWDDGERHGAYAMFVSRKRKGV